MISVYVAGAIAEIDRAEHWIERLRDAGVRVTSTWIAKVRAAPGARDCDVSDEVAASIASGCFAEIDESNVLWQLFPAERRGRGAFVELGYALAPLDTKNRALPVVSGVDLRESVFSRLCTTFPDDADAFAWIVARAKEWR